MDYFVMYPWACKLSVVLSDIRRVGMLNLQTIFFHRKLCTLDTEITATGSASIHLGEVFHIDDQELKLVGGQWERSQDVYPKYEKEMEWRWIRALR